MTEDDYTLLSRLLIQYLLEQTKKWIKAAKNNDFREVDRIEQIDTNIKSLLLNLDEEVKTK